jgi:Epoxide hydrolase N terminus
MLQALGAGHSTVDRDVAAPNGTNLAYLKTIVDYWRDKYDWRAQEKRFN